MQVTSDFTDLIIFGSHGHSVMIMRGMEEFWQGRVRLLAVIDELENGYHHPDLHVPVISMADRRRDWAETPVLVTPANTQLRARITGQLEYEGATLATAICPGQTHVETVVDYGPGCLCAPYTRIGPNVRVGASTQVLSTLLAHDIEIGAFSNLNVNSSVLGHVRIGAHVNIAPYAVIGNGTAQRPLTIGDGAIIGVGAVVVRDVAAGEMVGGNPAMPISRWKKLRVMLDAFTGQDCDLDVDSASQ